MSKKHLKLLDYQEDFVNSVESELAFTGDGDYFVDSCVSSGKSFMMSALAQELTGRIVILISITSLLDQIAEHLDIFDEPYSILKAGYDSKFFPERRIQLVMAQTLHARLDKIILKANYVIQDEGHREFMSPRTTSILSHLQHNSRFLFSGTCYDSQGFKFNGTIGTFKTVPMQTLIDRGRLAHVDYYVPRWANNIDYDSVKLVGGEYNTSSLEEIINSKNHLTMMLGSMNFMDAKNKKTLVFCSSIEQCNLVTEILKLDGYSAEAVHSKIAPDDQKAILESFKLNTIYAGHKSERQTSTLFSEASMHERPITCLVSVNKLGIGYSVEDVVLSVILRPTKIRSLYVQIGGRTYRSHQSKTHGEILDLAQVVKNFGFAQEEYEPPVRTGDKRLDRITIDKVNGLHAMEKLDIILNDDPTLVTREMYDAKVIEIQKAEDDFVKSKDAFKRSLQAKAQSNKEPENSEVTYAKSIATIINTTNDFYALISAGAEFWTILNGRPISKAQREYSFNPEWLCENIGPVLDKYPEKKLHWIKSYRTRVKNLCKQKGNYNGIKFFIDFLAEQYEQELEVERYKSGYETPEIDIDEDDLPF